MLKLETLEAGLYGTAVLSIVTLVLIAFAAFAFVRRKRLIAEVAPDLRSPILYLPGLINRFTRPFVKRGIAKIPLTSPQSVRLGTHRVPRTGAPSIRLVTFERENSTGIRPVLIWMHGGGYVVGSPEQDIAFVAKLLDRFDIVVASVDYRLAPEHPFPAPLDDCFTALEWVVEQSEVLGIDPSRLVVGGQSAGAGLAAALAQRALDQGPVTPIFQVLIYPMLDSTTVARKPKAGNGSFVWTPRNNRYAWKSYLGRDPSKGPFPDYAVPAARTEFEGLPAAWIGIGSLDLFYEENRAYADRLKKAGTNCVFYVADGAYHVFNAIFPDATTTKRFNESMFEALNAALS